MLVLTMAAVADLNSFDELGQAEWQVSINFKIQHNTDLSVNWLEMDPS